MGVDPASLAVKVALTAVSYGLSMLNKIEGPRLDSLDVTTADYGTPLNYFYGLRRHEGVPIIWAEKLREKKVTSKTKGGKYSQYKYYGTFAVAIADHPIDAITRIWMDKHLVYDTTKKSPITSLGGFFTGLSGAPVKLRMNKNMRVYLGTEDQLPDPRMEAWCEDRYGADSCPAYRGVSYIVFEELPLEKFGNRIPQITVEAVVNPTDNYLWDSVDVSNNRDPVISPDGNRMYAAQAMWDVPTRTKIADAVDIVDPIAIAFDGTIWGLYDWLGTGGGPFVQIWSSDGTSSTPPSAVSRSSFGIQIGYSNGVNVIVLIPYANFSDTALMSINGGEFGDINPGFSITSVEGDSQGNVWVAGRSYEVTEQGIYCIYGPRAGDGTIFTTASFETVGLFINESDEFVTVQGGTWRRIDQDFNILQTVSLGDTGRFTHVPYSDRLWRVTGSVAVEVNLTNLTEIRSLPQTAWVGAPGTLGDGTYDALNHAIVTNTGTKLVWRFIDRIAGSGVDLGDVVSDVSDRCNVPDYDVSALTQTVTGYSWTQGSGKDIISPLLDIHDVDACPHDFGITFKVRGSSTAGTISEFVREGDSPRYTVTIAQDTDIPRRITLNFADTGKDQQTNTVISQRPLDAADTVRTQQIDMTTYVATPAEAQKYADRYFRRKWNERETITVTLSAQYSALEPGDVYTLALDSVSQNARLLKTTFSQGRIETEWVRDEGLLHTLGTGTGATMDGRDEEVIFVPGPTKGVVKDLPLADDAHDNSMPQLYYGAGKYGQTDWPGAVVYEGDGTDYNPWKGVDSADGMTWGYTSAALNDCDPWVWDRGSSINVTSNAALTSVTEAEIDADPSLNLAIIGNEYVNFRTATLNGDGSYTLTGFKRGRRGTEWAVSTHAAGEVFVLVDSLARAQLGLSEVGTETFYKVETLGREITSSEVFDITFSGATLKPYAPASLKWVYNGTDLVGTITRRTRLGGAWVGGTTIPLSEASEAYEVDIYNGATLKRTITVSGTNSFTYTAAMASADGITLPTAPTAKVYQMSDAVGRGYELAA